MNYDAPFVRNMKHDFCEYQELPCKRYKHSTGCPTKFVFRVCYEVKSSEFRDENVPQ